MDISTAIELIYIPKTDDQIVVRTTKIAREQVKNLADRWNLSESQLTRLAISLGLESPDLLRLLKQVRGEGNIEENHKTALSSP